MSTTLLHRSVQIFKALGYSLLSPTCVVCRLPCTQHRDLCQHCAADFLPTKQACYQCALPLETKNAICGQCLRNPPPYQHCIAPYLYQAPLSGLIQTLKFQQQLVHANVLGHLLADHLQKQYAKQPLPEVIIPIPLHRNRLRQRGFNQAVEIGKVVSRRLQRPLDRYSARRVRNTQPQSDLTAEQRRHNLRGAFTINQLKVNHVAVLDDVITTGSTLQEFCGELRNLGIEKIDVWCVARTIIR